MKRGILVLIIIISVAILALAIFEFLGSKKPKPIFSNELNLQNKEGQNITGTQDYKDFSEKCEEAGGGVVLNVKDNRLECYKFAGNFGAGSGGSSGKSSSNGGVQMKSCTFDGECIYDCDFSSVISSGVCVLVFTDKDLSKETYTYNYECQGNVKGECSQLPLDKKFELNGNELIETGFRDFPQEQGEFSPV